MSIGRNWREVKAEAHRLYPELADPQRRAAADAQLDAYVAGHHLKELRESRAESPHADPGANSPMVLIIEHP
ncbi:hypothetical protein AB0L53_53975 [Nonomuraea sp. NPDC052129]|uniref:hypothetical protein n=1 Tax=Nonomuraea sp. NPDC052129 TaxID=3154651 RepID=UPI0034434C57